MPYVGSADQVTLTVTPYAGDTLATVVSVTTADAEITPAPAAISSDGGHTWTAALVWPDAGRWVIEWMVTGTGAGATFQTVWVSPAPTNDGPLWTPDRPKVADYVPGRTLSQDLTGARLTFDDLTRPTGDEVDRLIADAVVWVEAKTGQHIDGTLWEFATAVAAVYAAAMVERGYPTRADDVTTAQALWAQAVAMRDDLARANEAVTGQDPVDPGAALMPIYQFPAPVTWGDTDFY